MSYAWNPNDPSMDEASPAPTLCNPALLHHQQAILLQARAQAALNHNSNSIIPPNANHPPPVSHPHPSIPSNTPPHMVAPTNINNNNITNTNAEMSMEIQPAGAAPPPFTQPSDEFADVAALDHALFDDNLDFSSMSFPDLLAVINPTAEQQLTAAAPSVMQKLSAMHLAQAGHLPPNVQQQAIPSPAPPSNPPMPTSKIENDPVFLNSSNPTTNTTIPSAPAPTSAPLMSPTPMNAAAAAMLGVSAPMNAAAAAMLAASTPTNINNVNTANTAAMMSMPVSSPLNVPAGIVPVSAPMGGPPMGIIPQGPQTMLNPAAAAAASNSNNNSNNPFRMCAPGNGINNISSNATASPVGPMDTTTHPVFTQAAFGVLPHNNNNINNHNTQVPVVKMQPTPVPMPTPAQAAAAAAVATAANFVANAQQGKKNSTETDNGNVNNNNNNGRGGKKKRNPMRRTKAISWSNPTVLSAVDAIKAEQRLAPVSPQSLQQLAPQMTPGMVPALVPAMVAGMPTIPMVGGQMMPVVAAGAPPGMVAAVAGTHAGGGMPRLLPQVAVGLRGSNSNINNAPNQGQPNMNMNMNIGGAAALVKEEEERKMVRAERNRHSAAASRERKKQLLAELARQVAQLSRKNAELQIKQIQRIDEKRASEKKLKQEQAELKRTMQFLDMELAKVENMAEEQGLGQSEFQRERRKKLERPKTWDAGSDSWRAAARLVVNNDEDEYPNNNSNNQDVDMLHHEDNNNNN